MEGLFTTMPPTTVAAGPEPVSIDAYLPILIGLGCVWAAGALITCLYVCYHWSKKKKEDRNKEFSNVLDDNYAAYPAAQQPPPTVNIDWEAQARRGFIRKVYAILCTQLMITVAGVFFMMAYEPVSNYVLKNQWVYWISFAFVFITIFMLFCYKNSYPANFIILLLFTLAQTYMVGMICVIYQANGAGAAVWQAFALTVVIFIALSLFTMQSKIDFSFLGAGLFAALWILIFWGWMQIFFFPYWQGASQIYALVGAIIFSLYIVYDTYMITNRMSYDDYIIGAIELYLDVINLFLMLLALLGGRSNN